MTNGILFAITRWHSSGLRKGTIGWEKAAETKGAGEEEEEEFFPRCRGVGEFLALKSSLRFSEFFPSLADFPSFGFPAAKTPEKANPFSETQIKP